MNMTDYIKTYWPIFATIATIAVTMVVRDTSNEARITALEGRADRQTTSIVAIQSQVTSLSNDVSGMKSDIRSISSNVDYIRSRIDKAIQ